jgi:hypothetical protein
MVQTLPVIALSPPSAAAHPSATAHPSAAAETADAPRSHAREPAIALHARHPTVVVAAEYAVIGRRGALLKTWISEALLRREPLAIQASGLGAAERAHPAFGSKPAGHLAVGIRHA